MHRNRIRVGVALLAVISLLHGPVFAQEQKQNPEAATTGTPTQPEAQAPATTPVQPRTLDLKLDYSAGRKWFPDIISSYRAMEPPEPALTNSPRIEQLLQGGK